MDAVTCIRLRQGTSALLCPDLFIAVRPSSGQARWIRSAAPNVFTRFNNYQHCCARARAVPPEFRPRTKRQNRFSPEGSYDHSPTFQGWVRVSQRVGTDAITKMAVPN